MLGRLILLFITVPILEMAILIQLGEWLGLLPTLALVVLTGIAGATLARRQGLRVLLRIRAELAAGRMPVDKLVDGLLIFGAGVLLLTPGLLTDVVGLAVLLPGPRNWLKRTAGNRFSRAIDTGGLDVRLYREVHRQEPTDLS